MCVYVVFRWTNLNTYINLHTKRSLLTQVPSHTHTHTDLIDFLIDSSSSVCVWPHFSLFVANELRTFSNCRFHFVVDSHLFVFFSPYTGIAVKQGRIPSRFYTEVFLGTLNLFQFNLYHNLFPVWDLMKTGESVERMNVGHRFVWKTQLLFVKLIVCYIISIFSFSGTGAIASPDLEFES